MGIDELAQVTAVRALTPAYLTFADYPWLGALVEERQRFVGQRRREWSTRITEPFSFAAPIAKLRIALGVLDHLVRDREVGEPAPRKLRATVFRAAAAEPSRERALARAAEELNLSAEEIMRGLLCDLPEERVLVAIPDDVNPAQLALLCNEAIVSSLLHKAVRVRVIARGHVRAVVRHSKLVGLLCHAKLGGSKHEVVLEMSGPYGLFRHTRLYGRALASLLPRLARCNAYRLEADCALGNGQVGRLAIRSGDPIAPARELPSFDSQVEERFARSFAKLARSWQVVREPRPVVVGDALMFPDFELVHAGTGERWLLEIVGFWTPEYLARKLEQLRAARIERMIVCVDQERCCAEGALDAVGRVVHYKRKVDPRDVIAIIDPVLFAQLPAPTRRKTRSPGTVTTSPPGRAASRARRGACGRT
jgi:predicted nuclease of restriction endonuclease-like RecB superfamily